MTHVHGCTYKTQARDLRVGQVITGIARSSTALTINEVVPRTVLAVVNDEVKLETTVTTDTGIFNFRPFTQLHVKG